LSESVTDLNNQTRKVATNLSSKSKATSNAQNATKVAAGAVEFVKKRREKKAASIKL